MKNYFSLRLELQFETFSKNLQLNLESLVQRNLFLVVATEDFNAISSNWYCQDKANFEGQKDKQLRI